LPSFPFPFIILSAGRPHQRAVHHQQAAETGDPSWTWDCASRGRERMTARLRGAIPSFWPASFSTIPSLEAATPGLCIRPVFVRCEQTHSIGDRRCFSFRMNLCIIFFIKKDIMIPLCFDRLHDFNPYRRRRQFASFFSRDSSAAAVVRRISSPCTLHAAHCTLQLRPTTLMETARRRR
jgi:hypothetical protein